MSNFYIFVSSLIIVLKWTSSVASITITAETLKDALKNVTMDQPDFQVVEGQSPESLEEAIHAWFSQLHSSATPTSDDGPAEEAEKGILMNSIKKAKLKCFLEMLFKAIMKGIPDLGKIILGLENFMNGKDSTPLLNALQQFSPSLSKDAGKTLEKIGGVLEEDWDVYAWHAVRLWAVLQKPDVLQVIHRIQTLNEIRKFAELSKHCGVHLLPFLKKLENNLENPLYI